MTAISAALHFTVQSLVGSSGLVDPQQQTLAEEIVVAHILFVLALLPLVMWVFQMLFFAIAWYSCHFHLHRPFTADDVNGQLPGVSIVKPLMGVEPLLEANLESHFALEYPEFELLLCVQDECDPVLEVVAKMRRRHPDVKCRVFVGGKPGIVNPMVQNMAPAYEAASHDLVWVSTSRIRASTEILVDLVARTLSRPSIAVCHQLPFTANDSVVTTMSTVEKLAFGCTMAKNYLTLNRLGTHIFTGMSYVVRKSCLDSVGGLAFYGRYLAEDFFLSEGLHNAGWDLILSAFPAQQMVASSSLTSYRQRMVRWWRLRVNMLTVTTLLLEPLTECIPLGISTGWAAAYMFDVNPWLFFAGHLALWLWLDYTQLSKIQRQPLPFGAARFLSCWLLRELLTVWVYCEGILHPRTVTWGQRTYRVALGGLATVAGQSDKL